MDFLEKTTKSLFSEKGLQFVIPEYQRAYSWENSQCEQFFDDIYEQSKSENKYFLGNILVEEYRKNDHIFFEMVDGQQRITTIVIFVSASIITLEKKAKTENTGIDINELRKLYIVDNDQKKLLTSKIDQNYFESVIINNNTAIPKTKSQECIKSAKNIFLKKLNSLKNTSEIIQMINKLHQTIITVTKLDNKTDAAFMFELQNNRGKELTAMEQVKAYLMYQIYTNENVHKADKTISKLSEIYEKIYQSINAIKIDEDDLLWYHCNAYYGYSGINDNYDSVLDFVKDKIQECNEGSKKIEFINSFVLELQKTFANIKNMEQRDKANVYIRRLHILGIQSFKILYPLIINGYRYAGDSNDYSTKLFQIIEMLAFRIALIRTNGNVKLNSRLDKILGFEGNLNKLYFDIKKNFAGEEWRWTDDAMQEELNGPIYGSVMNNVLQYILKIYEEHIAGTECPKLKKICIEHISPQTPKQEENTGYELTKQLKYSKKFASDYLNCLGNLVLSVEKQNRDDLSNKNFKDKLAIYRDNKRNLGLMQQKEIEKFIGDMNKPQWGCAEIDKRREKIVNFAMQEWGFETKDRLYNYEDMVKENDIEEKWKKDKQDDKKTIRLEIRKRLEEYLLQTVEQSSEDKYVLEKKEDDVSLRIWIEDDNRVAIGFNNTNGGKKFFENVKDWAKEVLTDKEFKDNFDKIESGDEQIYKYLKYSKEEHSFSEYIDFISEKYLKMISMYESLVIRSFRKLCGLK
jgi:uncharacterized protein with ParB-like and HNH nuclease domain